MDNQPENKDTQQGENDTHQGEKTFTQEEVNKIVQERLAQIKTEPSEKEIALEQRAKDLDIRERRLKAKDLLSEKKLPNELLDILDYSDEEKMNEHIQILEKTYKAGRTGYAPLAGETVPPEDPVRKAMGLA